MIYLLIYCLFTYALGFQAMRETLDEDEHLIMLDIVMLVMSPITMTGVLVINILSHVIDLDKVVITRFKK